MGKSNFYQIRVKGHLDGFLAGWFDCLAVSNLEEGYVLLSSPNPDQVALQGILKPISNLGTNLIYVNNESSG